MGIRIPLRRGEQYFFNCASSEFSRVRHAARLQLYEQLGYKTPHPPFFLCGNASAVADDEPDGVKNIFKA